MQVQSGCVFECMCVWNECMCGMNVCCGNECERNELLGLCPRANHRDDCLGIRNNHLISFMYVTFIIDLIKGLILLCLYASFIFT